MINTSKHDTKAVKRKILKRAFYERDVKLVARKLLGKRLVRKTKEGVTSGIIVETEAYLPENDPACHAARGMTPRNSVMYERGGTAYVYFTYGNHYLVNAVAHKKGVPSAVLIRALEPLDGIALMMKRRNTENVVQLCNGPGKLCQALGVTKDSNMADLTSPHGGLYIMDTACRVREEDIHIATRIGIREGSGLPLRFYLKGSRYISRK